MPNNKTIQIGVLIFLVVGLLFTTASALAYWQEVTISNTITIGTIREGVDIEVTNITEMDENVRLVPEGYVMFVGDVDEVTLTYNVSVTRELLNSVDLYINAHSVTIGESADYEHLVDISINNDTRESIMDIFNDMVTIEIAIKLLEPIDEQEAITLGFPLTRVNVDDSIEAYNTIKGQEINFTLRFELRNKTDQATE
ncbi:MAG: hypothetical protein ACOC1L_03670 [Bacillota bacterium]